ncbi:MAG: undecaprenyldiphospho-muramoylpentapeptide beta-N-acetylglucosaminyltransferase [Deltaproteobacteria bacterium]|nr:undecaprenyldiphospho-muramoylpentapeptide beta-N-acetylglucosaminyltransferase [Deltaproteobacteria bacterium]
MTERVAWTMLIAGGGTGGHLFPALAVAEEFRDRNQANSVHFLGTRRGMEARVIPRLGYPLHFIDVEGLKGKNPLLIMRAAVKIPGSIMQSLAILKSLRPDIVLGVGGYAAGPVVLAAALAGITTAIQEQNVAPGLTNRLLGHVARRVFLSFDESVRWFQEKKVVVTGNPVRREICNVRTIRKSSREPSTVFVFGGSQGSAAINRTVIEALPYMIDRKRAIRFIHQTGAADRKILVEAYKKSEIAADVHEFINDMREVYDRADIVVCRAGATSIAEITALGKASILIPYPYAAGNHQAINARMLADDRAAVMIEEKDLTGRDLAAAIMGLIDDGETRLLMEEHSYRRGRRDATRRIVDELMELAKQ